MTTRIYCSGVETTATFHWRRRGWFCDHCGKKVKVVW